MADEPFTAEDVGWIESPDVALQRLVEDPLEVLGVINDASNATMLCRLGEPDDALYAIYKPEQGERPLWDFPEGTLYRREVAAYAVSSFLGWEVVPPTVVREDAYGVGSLQLFVPHDPSQHYFVLVDQPRWHRPLARLAMLDMVLNNADRKGGHILRHAGTDRLYGIDNGLTFHPEPKLRTVVWDVADVAFEDTWKADMHRLCEALQTPAHDLVRTLAELLSPVERVLLAKRAEQVTRMDHVPEIAAEARNYPWPPV